MRCATFLCLPLLLLCPADPAAAAPDPRVAPLLAEHVRALGRAREVRSLRAVFDVRDDRTEVKRATGAWDLGRGLCRREFPLGAGRPPLVEYFGAEGAFLSAESFERYRPGQLTTRGRYYFMQAVADPFPLLRYVDDARLRETLKPGWADLKGVRHPVLSTAPDAYGVRTVFLLDPATHMIANIRFEAAENEPFTQLTLHDYKRVDGVMLPHTVYAYLYTYYESTGKKKIVPVRRPFNRAQRILEWNVGADVGDVAFSPPGVTATEASGFAREVLPTGPDPLAAGVGDLDGDGRPDLAVACWGGLYVHFGGRERDPVRVELGAGHHAGVAIDDFDCDGRLEVLTTSNVSPANMYFMVGFDAARKPVVRRQYGAPLFTREAVSADLDYDGIPDMVAVGHASGDLQIKFGNACGGVRLVGLPWPLDPKHEGFRGYGVAVGDLDGNPMRDIAVVDGRRLLVFQGEVNLSFHPRMQPLPLPRPVGVAMADLDGDGRDDFLVVNDHPQQQLRESLTVVRNLGNRLEVVSHVRLGGGVLSVASGDFDGDGFADAVASSATRGGIAVLLGDGEGGLSDPVEYASGRGTERVAVVDWNADGRDDVAAVNRLDDSVSLFVNTRGFARRPRRIEERALACPPPTRVAFELRGLSDPYEFAGEFRLPQGVREPSGITCLGGDAAHSQLLLVSDKEPVFFRAVLDRRGERLVVGPPVPLRGLEREKLDLEGVVYDQWTGNLFLACEADNSIVRATIFGHVLGRAATGIEAGDNDGIEGIALRRKKDGTPLLYVCKERMGRTGAQPFIRCFAPVDEPFALTRRGEDFKLPYLLPDQTGAAIVGDRMYVLGRLVRGLAEMEFGGDDRFAPDARKAAFGKLTDNELELYNPLGRLYGVAEGLAVDPQGDLLVVLDDNGGPMGREGLNRGRGGRLLWFRNTAEGRKEERPRRVVFKQILVPWKGAVDAPERATWGLEEARGLANSLAERARAGEDFDTLAGEMRSVSHVTALLKAVDAGQRPVPGEVTRSDLPAPLGRLAFALRVGEIGIAEWDEEEAPRGFRVVMRVE